jgi:phosphoribosylaminoimidazole-succinocarboxamide synthase
MPVADSNAIFESDIPGLDRIARGKVRDIYAVDDERLAIVATDRLSAYDVVLPDPIPGKGEILTRISRFWFDRLEAWLPNHLLPLSLRDVAGDSAEIRRLEPRTMIVKRLAPLPVEAVVRGYLIGSGWRDYVSTGTVCGVRLPAGLQQAAKLSEPLFTPATKAAAGEHDENIGYPEMVRIVGERHARQVRDATLRTYRESARYALSRGIIIADTKLEFGADKTGRLFLIDEVLTPDSSRFWPADEYAPGGSPPSFDKQYVRDYLDTLEWDKTPPGPSLPPDVIRGTAQRYRRALELLTGAPAAS